VEQLLLLLLLLLLLYQFSSHTYITFCLAILAGKLPTNNEDRTAYDARYDVTVAQQSAI